jgi:hypothetical protein
MRAAFCVGASLAAVLLGSLSCKKATPTPPSPTVVSITITPATDMLKVKETVTLAATARHSDGSDAPVTDWRSDTPGVATVDAATGKVAAVTAGAATIVATHDGMSATRPVRVVPDFAGSWFGGFEITACSATGVFATEGVCQKGYYQTGTTGPLRLEDVTQDRDTVAGELEYPVYAGPTGTVPIIGTVRGTIGTSGHLTLTGALTRGEATFALSDVTDLYIESDRMRGVFTLVVTESDLPPDSRVVLRHTISGSGLSKMGVATPRPATAP